MAVDVTPPVADHAKYIDSYGPGRFKITDQPYEGSVIVFPDRVVSWDVSDPTKLTLDDFKPVLEATPPVELLILGCGEKMVLLPQSLRQQLRDKGLPPDFMDTGAAARTYNILLTEGRRVAAALIAMPVKD
ncbi:MAG: Mth938-like domain-containing protein [Alphaproteobacteria bacterium]|nr:Mth938-like domain-containing protein [Alphaproteobacteria bacterium]